MRITFLTLLAMLAFAGNSIIARLALSSQGMEPALIDPENYALIRLVSGAAVLGVLVGIKQGFSWKIVQAGNWVSAFSLFLYGAAFAYSYVMIDTGLGALILFACVQLTMIGWAVIKGQSLSVWEIAGSLLAFGALIWLVSPGIAAPDPFAAFLMAISGIAWGAYSLRGQTSSSPLNASAGNFILTIPMLIILIRPTDLQLSGIALAILSGAITSGLGYALWYSVLPKLSTAKAAIWQLSVPVFAGIGGSLLLSEAWTLRFTIASILILSGVTMAIFAKQARTLPKD
ncbi:DMT family transporter [Hirschia litorea]|uniref:DMT family transporter n=1 Tax=Hirschia litorea TaxID=1199156 RepID=A0ABW2IJJ0_9PROT